MLKQRTLLVITLISVSLWTCTTQAAPHGPDVETLLETSQTILGQPFAYPQGQAAITAAIVTVPPHAELQAHFHSVPLFGYMLQGELVVNYGSEGERTYRKGDAFVEAIDWVHQGRNGGRGNVRILVVYAGAEGTPNTTLSEF